ncbi:dCTP deaminase [Candidatus Woesearchaeota archaeon CG10_big_fil_rev_8_21_14_0_10_34_8]|nr:MAG: dCTP deaminase [Candidatus Woesearchaeota archaeon CG10_big_fil_rev_8_21_14_0_10_34_8]
MVVLSDKDIRESIKNKDIIITCINEDQIGSCSIDLRLGNTFRVFKHAEVTHVDPKQGISDDLMSLVVKKEDEAFIIHPGEFVLGTTIEHVQISRSIVARLDGRSSWGRLGIIIHSTAGSVQPGYAGQLTLEIANISKVPVKLWPGAKICQLTFERLSSPCEKSYGERNSKYMDQKGPEVSRISLD